MSATVQGLFNAMFMGFGMAVGGLIGGPLLESAGGRGLFFFFGIAVLTIVVIVALIQRRLPAEQQIVPSVVID
jgi:predicted MFS family arabinose efflux permease